MKTCKDSLDALRERLKHFARERDWEQFHSPKNLSMALIVEAAELCEHFQWLTEQESMNLNAEKLAKVSEELADILIYLIRLADRLGIDLIKETYRKIEINELKYPVQKVKGRANKYTEY